MIDIKLNEKNYICECNKMLFKIIKRNFMKYLNNKLHKKIIPKKSH